MKTKENRITWTDTAPGTASTTKISSTLVTGLHIADQVSIDAKLVGVTGGTLDVYIQRKLATDDWYDWVHFPQIAAGTTKRYSFSLIGEGATIVEVGGGTDAAPGVGLAANTAVNVAPTAIVRVIMVTGGGTSGTPTQTINFTPLTVHQ